MLSTVPSVPRIASVTSPAWFDAPMRLPFKPTNAPGSGRPGSPCMRTPTRYSDVVSRAAQLASAPRATASAAARAPTGDVQRRLTSAYNSRFVPPAANVTPRRRQAICAEIVSGSASSTSRRQPPVGGRGVRLTTDGWQTTAFNRCGGARSRAFAACLDRFRIRGVVERRCKSLGCPRPCGTRACLPAVGC